MTALFSKSLLLPGSATAEEHAAAEFLALFRRHLFPALPKSMPPTAVTAPSAEQDFAQDEQTQRMDVVDLVRAAE